MIQAMEKPKNRTLANYLLKILNEKYACASEIKVKLESRHIEYKNEDFSPVLSNLLLNNCLCYNWINRKNARIKYYHLTQTGRKEIAKLV